MCTIHMDPAPSPASLADGEVCGETFPHSGLGWPPCSNPSQWAGEGAAMGSSLGVLQQPQQRLSDTQEVDHLGNAKQRGNDQRTAVGAFQEG